jgi:hypothetical protein
VELPAAGDGDTVIELGKLLEHFPYWRSPFRGRFLAINADDDPDHYVQQERCSFGFS